MRVNGIRIDVGERELHAMSAQGRADLAAASRDTNASVFERIFSDPRNSATPTGTADALARLKKGELLSAVSTQRLLGIMTETETGANRLKAGLPKDWALAHKTGTGGDTDGASNGTNDVGVMTAPNGRSYAVAVFTWGTRRPMAEREQLMADVARAVVDWENARPAAH
jgi:beta-lactamase class A